MNNQIILGCEYNWWLNDPLPELKPLDGFRASSVDDPLQLARLQRTEPDEMQRRIDEGNLCYVAFLDDDPVGYGWVATRVGEISEMGMAWRLASLDRHLWDFATLPESRGLGVYPQLLQAVLRSESQRAEHFWIGHRSDNLASRSGILKAGFNLHWLFVLTAKGKVELQPQADMKRINADPRWPVIHTWLNAVPPELLARIRASIAP